MMRALYLGDNGLSVEESYPQPAPAAGEALVQIVLAGICSTDLELLRGYAGFRGVPGHEFVGVVVACEEAPRWVGQRVVGEINVGCGWCDRCLAGRREHCPARAAVGIRGHDGTFADYLALPVANLHAVPANVPDESAVFAEPLAAALEIRQQIALRPADRVAVLGDGKLGQLVARSLAGTGCDLVVIGRQPERRSMALLRQAGIATAVSGDLPGGWADVVVECTGSPLGFASALDLLRPEGTLVLKSTYSGLAEVDLSRVVVDEIRVVGSRCGPFEPALRLLAAGDVDPTPLIEAVYPLAGGVAAFAHAAQRGVLKILLRS